MDHSLGYKPFRKETEWFETVSPLMPTIESNSHRDRFQIFLPSWRQFAEVY